MEDLKELIAAAVEQGVKRGLENVNFTTNGKDPNELLTMEQIHEETGIGINMLQKMFKDKELAVQRYTSPFKVTRGAFNKYVSERHDYLSERSETNEKKTR